ncbi:hypothetical protein [Sabulicella glaciei]|uniref:Uncharacterized protein n=1 Tax=Sabulicella glaciei TaxID=2984948 RepID=A0ABT3NX94_9PROT|nr:hypothetical protein [Roseococcus sp. MDT2-1-1]MCW8086793.1 hypothetical protein [Roseococcus sp. MDT2-1-1]
MISTNSLAAFTPEVTRARPGQPARPVAPAPDVAPIQQAAAQRTLEAVPPAPDKPLPRGSLLDLRV